MAIGHSGSYYRDRDQAPMTVVICDSGLVLKMKDVVQLSLRAFEEDDKIVERLRGIEDGEAFYLKTKKYGVQKLSIDNQYNLRYHYSEGNRPTSEHISKRIISSWLAIEQEDRS